MAEVLNQFDSTCLIFRATHLLNNFIQTAEVDDIQQTE